MARTPGTEHVPKEPYDERDLIVNIGETIDNRIDDLIGLRPLRTIAKPLTSLAPANVIHNATNLPKPSQLIEEAESKIDSDISSKRGLPDLRGMSDLAPPKLFR